MRKILIRAKSAIKLVTPQGSHVDETFTAGTEIKQLALSTIHALVQAEGTQGARAILEDKLATYRPDYLGLGE